MVIVHHEDLKNDDDTYIELYAVKRYWKVHKEGDLDYFFDAQAPKKTMMNRGCSQMPLEFT